MSPQAKLRAKNALVSGASSFVALLAMAVWFGGMEGFLSIVIYFVHLFLVVSFLALVLGAFLSTSRIRWSVLIGTLSGILGGFAIALYVVSNI